MIIEIIKISIFLFLCAAVMGFWFCLAETGKKGKYCRGRIIGIAGPVVSQAKRKVTVPSEWMGL